MRVQINNRRLTLEDRDLIGVGGEARVYRDRDLAIKIYHGVDPNAGPAEQVRLARLYELRKRKIHNFPNHLPSAVLGPRDLVLDPHSGETIGFTMKLVHGTDFRKLALRGHGGSTFDRDQLAPLFHDLWTTVDHLHRHGVVIGDLNDGNVLFDGSRAWVIDADSLQFSKYPCVVAHERFLDPQLYNIDFDKEHGVFTPESDWYSFSVMLLSSLVHVHPYGGVHPSYPTLLHRAEARCSVFDDSVLYPKGAIPLSVLPEPLSEWFRGLFERGERGRFPKDLLRFRWVRCGCGCTHARKECPNCRSGRLINRPATLHRGACRAETVLHTAGRIEDLQLSPRLSYAVYDDGELRREDGTLVTVGPRPVGLTVQLSGNRSWLALGSRVLGFDGDELTVQYPCGSFRGSPAVSANTATLCRVDGDWLLSGNKRLGRVLENNTWIATGDAFGVGLYRAGEITRAFCFDPDVPGLRALDVPHLKGRLLDISAVFSRSTALLEWQDEYAGKQRAVSLLIASDGRILAREEGSPDSNPLLHRVGGKALSGTTVLCSTDNGLVAYSSQSGHFSESTRFADTEPFVNAESSLYPAPGGAVWVLDRDNPDGTSSISLLTLKLGGSS